VLNDQQFNREDLVIMLGTRGACPPRVCNWTSKSGLAAEGIRGFLLQYLTTGVDDAQTTIERLEEDTRIMRVLLDELMTNTA